jgi:hypothetical protein
MLTNNLNRSETQLVRSFSHTCIDCGGVVGSLELSCQLHLTWSCGVTGFRDYFLSREGGSYGFNLKRDKASPRF